MVGSEQSLLFRVENDEPQSPGGIEMMRAPERGHRFRHSQLYRAPASVVIRRLGRVGLAVVMTTDDDYLRRARQAGHRDLDINGWSGGWPPNPAPHRKPVAAPLR